MQQETELFFDSQVREDRSVSDLLTANYTFVNEPLAKHYGIPNVYGDHFRRVTLTDERRFGLLGQGSILTVTSYANRTSPVIRGKWLLENFLGDAAAAAAAECAGVEGERRGGQADHGAGAARAAPQESALRELSPAHGSAGLRAGEFRRARPLARRWTPSRKKPIDASGAFADGTKFNGPVEFRNGAAEASSRVRRDGRREAHDLRARSRAPNTTIAPAIRQILRDAAPNDYRWSSIILGIVKSKPFQMRAVADGGVAQRREHCVAERRDSR